MSFIKRLFGKEDPARTYEDFWNWFKKHERKFYDVVKNEGDVENVFFDKLSLKLEELKDGYFYLTGMYDDSTVELVLTADGNVPNVVFVEELVASAPEIDGWKFTALKPALPIEDVSIEMAGFNFNAENIWFYPNELAEYPDEIDITVIHQDLTDENKEDVTTGIFIFLDNYLGELDFLTNIDNLKVIGKAEAEKELISIVKLRDYLKWRQKEFIEKYEGVRYNTEEDHFSIFRNGPGNEEFFLAVINTDLLNWDSKASHPWVLEVKIKYDGSGNNGMPHEQLSGILEEIEAKTLAGLKDEDGYLNIGRQTIQNLRTLYFVCRDFRKPSKLLSEIQNHYASEVEITFDIYKDKYWQTFERFM